MTTINEIHWIAGILEGEGCFGFHHTPTIQINMVDLDTIEKIRALICPDKRITLIDKKGNQIQYKLYICGSAAAQWMMTIYPLMSIRRKIQIKECLTKWNMMSRNPNVKVKNNAIKALSTLKNISYEEAEKLFEAISGNTIQ